MGGRGLRLRGRSAEAPQSLLLSEGDNLVGSAASNTIVVPARGVSRHHAAIRIAAGAALVVDLESKNGVRVNGRSVGQSPLAPGDEVSFGPVSFLLEEVAEDDAAIGFALAVDDVPGPDPSDPAPTSRIESAETPAAAWVRLLEEVVDRLDGVPGDPQGALAAVVRRLGLAGGAVVEWRGAPEPVLEVVAGRVGELPGLEAALASRGSRLHDRPQGDPPCSLWAERGADGVTCGLVLWGEFAGRRESASLVATLGRLFRSRLERADPLASLDRPPSRREGLRFPRGHVAGESPAMRALYRQMEMLLRSDLPVLICGETGVGKEPIARTLHASSARRGGPFVAVNCAAIPGDLLEAEMFGIGHNVATGVAGRAGKFVEASGGTLLLDEVGDMPLPLQAKLLRALEEREVQPVGAPAVAIDVHLLAATNVDLRRRAQDGGFRRDLYYRIAGFVLDVPPLRRRGDDLPQLVGHFLRQGGREAGKSVRGLTVKALRHLTEYPWPGNVRELHHEMMRLVYLCPYGGVIDSTMIPDHILAPPAPDERSGGEAPASSLDLRTRTEALERRLIRLALLRAGGNQSHAARLLGLSRNGLANRLKRLGIDPTSPGG